MAANGNPLTDHLDLWTSALLTKSTAGRGGKGKQEAYGIKKLRELILELAVRGKLVPQDSNDEPASALLYRITVEKARLVLDGTISKLKLLPPINAADLPFALPEGWAWTRLGGIASKITDGDHKTPPRITAGYRLLSAKNVRDGYLEFDTCDFIAKEHYLKSRERCLPETGDLLIVSVGGTIGRTSLVPADANFALVRSVALIKKLLMDSSYLKYAMDSEFLQSTIHARKRGGAQPCLYLSEIENFLLPLPPLAEQRRIVAKVDELMALCDRLEQQQTDSQEAHQTLVESLLGTLTQIPTRAEPVEARPSTSPGRTDFEEAWTRIADHFDTLFTTEHSIDQLKQTVLQLAVMGKLVTQDPNDEPASLLLEKITTEQTRMIEDGVIRKQPSRSEVTDQEKPNQIPASWEWVRLTDVYYSISPSGRKLKTSEIINEGTYPVVDQGQSYIAGYTNEPNLLIAIPGPVVVFGDHTTEIKYIDFNFVAGADGTKILRPYLMCERFFYTYLRSYKLENRGYARHFKVLNENLMALPPLAEQHRIVAKVDELMALCDTMKARLKAAQTTQINLADAIVDLAAA